LLDIVYRVPIALCVDNHVESYRTVFNQKVNEPMIALSRSCEIKSSKLNTDYSVLPIDIHCSAGLETEKLKRYVTRSKLCEKLFSQGLFQDGFKDL
jgi:hypothetical protein